MRKDSAHNITGILRPLEKVRVVGARLFVSRFFPVIAWGIVCATSMAVALLSWWLVPPYLAIVSILLYEPKDRLEENDIDRNPELSTSRLEEDQVEETLSETGDTDNVSNNSTTNTVVKPRRARRTRAKKPRLPIENVTKSAKWIQTAPGKFVRVEVETAEELSSPIDETTENSHAIESNCATVEAAHTDFVVNDLVSVDNETVITEDTQVEVLLEGSVVDHEDNSSIPPYEVQDHHIESACTVGHEPHDSETSISGEDTWNDGLESKAVSAFENQMLSNDLETVETLAVSSSEIRDEVLEGSPDPNDFEAQDNSESDKGQVEISAEHESEEQNSSSSIEMTEKQHEFNDVEETEHNELDTELALTSTLGQELVDDIDTADPALIHHHEPEIAETEVSGEDLKLADEFSYQEERIETLTSHEDAIEDVKEDSTNVVTVENKFDTEAEVHDNVEDENNHDEFLESKSEPDSSNVQFDSLEMEYKNEQEIQSQEWSEEETLESQDVEDDAIICPSTTDSETSGEMHEYQELIGEADLEVEESYQSHDGEEDQNEESSEAESEFRTSKWNNVHENLPNRINVRSSRMNHLPFGYRKRSSRSAGRKHEQIRAYSPRSSA